MPNDNEHRLMPNMVRTLGGNRALADQVIAEVEDSIWLAEHDREVAEKAWDEGHKTRWRRDWDDGCYCYARSSGECACGNYGTGKLLSLNDNPYRGAPEQEGNGDE